MLDIVIATQDSMTGIYVNGTRVGYTDHYNVGDDPEGTWKLLFGDHVDFTVQRVNAEMYPDPLPRSLTELHRQLGG